MPPSTSLTFPGHETGPLPDGLTNKICKTVMIKSPQRGLLRQSGFTNHCHDHRCRGWTKHCRNWTELSLADRGASDNLLPAATGHRVGPTAGRLFHTIVICICRRQVALSVQTSARRPAGNRRCRRRRALHEPFRDTAPRSLSVTRVCASRAELIPSAPARTSRPVPCRGAF